MKTDQYKTEKGVVCSACGTRLVKPWPDNEKGQLYCPRHRMMIPEWMVIPSWVCRPVKISKNKKEVKIFPSLIMGRPVKLSGFLSSQGIGFIQNIEKKPKILNLENDLNKKFVPKKFKKISVELCVLDESAADEE